MRFTGYVLAAAVLLVSCTKSPSSVTTTSAEPAPAPPVGKVHIGVVDAPFHLGLRPPKPGHEPGVRKLADALRGTGLVARLGAADRGAVPPPAYAFEKDPETRIYNAAAIRSYSEKLARSVEEVIQRGEFALVLGGDCSILVGALSASSPRKHRGLIYMDAHTDFGPPPAVGGGIALALATGYGPPSMQRFGGRLPLVREEDAVLFGARDPDDLRDFRGRSKVEAVDLAKLRGKGAKQAARDVVTRFRSQGVDDVWIHLDADVLDDAIMPAVDSRSPDGLSYAELKDVLSEFLSSGLVTGMDIAIFDPELDPTGKMARAFSDALVEVLPLGLSNRQDAKNAKGLGDRE
ncbi:arginase family protein [Pendulispora brunnea]|uniref:Arginase family protein n=1 Tax=Pendulispora brunnea TaxID=2905690 RepID=A0ABZ2K9X7_9BACT